jgi:hypothetical protein
MSDRQDLQRQALEKQIAQASLLQSDKARHRS